MHNTLNMLETVEEMKGKDVLVVEDSYSCYLLINEYLKKMGATGHRAISASEAENIIARHNICLALVDIVLPKGENGIDITRKIKRLNPDIPVIIQTAYVSPMEIGKCFMAGCDDFLTKPFKYTDLTEKINSLANCINA